MMYCTVTSNQYLSLAIVLAKSIKQADPNGKVFMCLVEEDYSFASPHLGNFDHVILAKELGFSNFYRHMFTHNAYEASGSCKAILMLHAFEKFQDEDHFVFLDSDMMVFGPFDEIKDGLNHHSIILSPHILEPGNVMFEEGFSRYGVFNTGFFAIKRSAESYYFLNWWADRLERACFNEPDMGFFLEQKWLDAAPAFFNVNILRHPGYNVAGWNLHQRHIEGSYLGDYKVNGQPLRLFHFSNILKVGHGYTDFLNKASMVILEPSVGTIVNHYIKELAGVGIDFTKKIPWSYDYYADGKPIEKLARFTFRQSPQTFVHIGNPFIESNRTFITQTSV